MFTVPFIKLKLNQFFEQIIIKVRALRDVTTFFKILFFFLYFFNIFRLSRAVYVT